MIASLPMYARAENKSAHDRFWYLCHEVFADGGVAAPAALTDGFEGIEHWLSPDLFLGQTCGCPYRKLLHGKVELIGTPDYGIEGCKPGYYRSLFVVRDDDPQLHLAAYADARFAYNEKLSQSGWMAPQTHAQVQGFTFTNLFHSGAHLASAQAVADGVADIASLDAVSWEMVCRYDSFAAKLRVLERTAPTPGLPYIAHLGADQTAYFKAISQAIDALDDGDRQTLQLQGLVWIPAADYLKVSDSE